MRLLLRRTLGAIAILATLSLGVAAAAPLAQSAQRDTPTDAEISGLTSCENYGVWFTVTVSGFWGGGQFLQSTWDGITVQAGRSELAGTRPDTASPTDQAAMIRALYARDGITPWPECGYLLEADGRHVNGYYYDYETGQTMLTVDGAEITAARYWRGEVAEVETPTTTVVPSFTG